MESSKTEELPDNPTVKANFLSHLTFWYTLPVFRKGQKKTLEPSDLYKVLDEHKSNYLGDKISKAWEQEVRKKDSSKKPPNLLKTLFNVFGWSFAKLGIILLCLEFGLRITQPLFLGGLLNYYGTPDGNIWQAYIYAGAIIATTALNVLTQHAFMLGQMHLGMKIRISLVSLIYRKALRLTQTALGNTTTGKIVNLLSNDVGRFDHALIGLHQLWVGPLEIIAVVIIIYHQIGISALAGVCFLLGFIPLQTFIGKKTSTFRAKTAMRSDERIRLMNEIIQGIQVIKMYAWEQPFGKLVAAARRREINTIRYTSYMRAIMLSFNIFVTRFSIFISLIAYALLGGYITAEQAFVVTAYYNILRQTMTVHFTRGITQLADVFVSTNRIQQFLTYEEIKVKLPVDDQVTLNGDTQNNISLTDNNTVIQRKSLNGDMENLHRTQDSLKGSLTIESVKAKWNPEANDYTLDDLSFTVSPGELIAIIGPVGAGKSSLIQSIIGELPIETGSIQVHGSVSYACQDVWLFGGTIQQNILFGKPMDKKRYREAIKHCALERDLELLPFGDQTIVGDKGQSLSGGQKARISLARVVYRKASIYLLDDPLSAVDTHVGRHLFEECMQKYLKGRTVILATHQLQFIQQADKIILMDQGKISAIGTYSELKDQQFTHLLLDNEVDENATMEDESSDTSSGKFSRQNSESSTKSVETEPNINAQTQVKETYKQGSIGFKLYSKYFRAGGGLLIIFVTFLFCISAQVLGSATDYFLSFWVNEETRVGAVVKNNTAELLSASNNLTSEEIYSALHEERKMLDVYIFTGLVVATIVVTLSRSFLVFDVCIRASKRLHEAMYQGISQATLYFFNTNPVGRILNRFSKDIGQVDESLPLVVLEVIQIFLALAGIVMVIILVNTWFIIPTVLMITLFYNLRSFYLKTSRNVKRIEGVTRSPIFSHLSASLMGLSTIRSFGAQDVLCREFDQLQDLHSSTFFMFLSTNRAFGFWLDSICVLYIATVTLSFFVLGEEQAGNVGLAITQALGMTGMVQWGMRQSAELENTMTAVERVVEYEALDKESELQSKETNQPPPDWPQDGHVKFENLSLRYFPDPKSDHVLRELNVEILPSEKVGIVGRTGAGKSSIINALFRLAYLEGSVIIDSRNTSKLSLHDLRSKISIIPQDPVLFSGTLRYNLDPFDEYSDAKIWEALEQVKLKQTISEQALGLQTRVTEGGTNFSIGQRQLVCLARAILRENRILVLDEATANVDHQTDNVIQSTIRDKFRDCTVITIAHRLHTIMDSDKVLVMDAGQIVEYAPPYVLLTASESKVFYEMVLQTGDATFKSLLQVAKDAYEARTKV